MWSYIYYNINGRWACGSQARRHMEKTITYLNKDHDKNYRKCLEPLKTEERTQTGDAYD